MPLLARDHVTIGIAGVVLGDGLCATVPVRRLSESLLFHVLSDAVGVAS
jgi:hypothetical protein